MKLWIVLRAAKTEIIVVAYILLCTAIEQPNMKHNFRFGIRRGCGSLYLFIRHFSLDSAFVSAQSIIKPKLSERPFATENSIHCSRHDYYLYLTSRCKCPLDLWECARRKWLNHNINFRKNFIPFPLSRIAQCQSLSGASVVNVINCPRFVCRFLLSTCLALPSMRPMCVSHMWMYVHLCRTGDDAIDNTKSSNQNTNTHACRHAG